MSVVKKSSKRPKVRPLLIRVLLEIILFVDFLGDLPQKFIKYSTKGLILTVFFGGFLIGLIFESQTATFHNLISYIFIPEPQLTFVTPQEIFPKLKKPIEFPEVTSGAVLVVDVKNDKILFAKDSHIALPPASTTKLMTALVALDIYTLDQLLLVPEVCVGLPDTQQVGFTALESLTVRDLIASLLINSAGDAACTLSYGNGSYDAFIVAMNEKAQELRLTSTTFSNPIGFDANGQHVSSAYDLYLLSQQAVNNEFLKSIVQTKEYNIESGVVQRKVFNTNDLLWDIPGTVGVKTGRTYEAGEVLIYQYKKDSIDIVVVVMGSADRFGDTKMILDWSLQSYDFGV